MKRTYGWAAVLVLLVGGVSRAQEKTLPPVPSLPPPSTSAAPEPMPLTPLTPEATGTEVNPQAQAAVAPQTLTPAFYADLPCHARRHPILLWLTYVPARRPYFDGHCLQKAPNLRPPLYDYFPCTSDQCYNNFCGQGCSNCGKHGTPTYCIR